jgi:hypothetical protein
MITTNFRLQFGDNPAGHTLAGGWIYYMTEERAAAALAHEVLDPDCSPRQLLRVLAPTPNGEAPRILAEITPACDRCQNMGYNHFECGEVKEENLKVLPYLAKFGHSYVGYGVSPHDLTK